MMFNIFYQKKNNMIYIILLCLYFVTRVCIHSRLVTKKNPIIRNDPNYIGLDNLGSTVLSSSIRILQ